MSAETIGRIYRRFVDGIDTACASGQGAEYMLDYFAATGRHVAATTYLAMSLRRNASDQKLDCLPDIMMGQMAEGIREIFGKLGYGADPFVTQAEVVAVAAFAEHLDQLIVTAHQRGSA